MRLTRPAADARERTESAPAIPKVRGHRLLGAGYTYESDRIGALGRWAERHGDVFRYDRGTVVVNDPELVHTILAGTNRAFAATTPLVEHRGGAEENLDLWMRGRRRTGRGVHPDAVDGCVRRLDDGLAHAIAALADRDLDLLPAAERIAGHAITDICLGPDAPAFYEHAALASDDILAVSRTLSTPPWQEKKRHEQALAAEHGLSDRLGELITARRADASLETPRDLLDVLTTGPRRPADDVTAAILRITLVGGHGTPGAALAWILRELAIRPDVNARVRAEADVLPEAVAANDTALLTYTTALVKEILRAYPPTWLLARDVPEVVSLGGRHVEAGQRVVFSPYLIHRDRRWWTEPDRIDPQRWLGTDPPHSPRAYLPFGGGPRVCPGARLGLSTLVLATIRAAHHDIAVDGPRDWEPTPDVLLVPTGLKLRLATRRDREPRRTA